MSYGNIATCCTSWSGAISKPATARWRWDRYGSYCSRSSAWYCIRLFFGTIAKLPSDGQPYAVFTYVALLPWTLFSDAVGGATNSLLTNKALIAKIYFPRLLFPISQFLTSLVDFAISFCILLAMMFYYHIPLHWGVLLLPVFLLIAGVTGSAIGLWFSGLIVRYHDFGQIVGLAMRFLMYATPVVYSISIVPERWRLLYRLNPMTSVVEGFRWALLGTSPPPDWTLAVGCLLVLPVFIGGLYYFKRVERNIVDVA